jgi:hypothetical protein
VARNLVVLTGAGASFDCASGLVRRREEMRPPLVKDLFGPSFDEILLLYPFAQAAAAGIRRAIAPGSKSAMPLEQFLRERVRDAESSYAQRRYRQIPLYLQHVLLAVSATDGTGFTRDVDNYNALLNEALEYESVLFLTLNYDTLLDDRLFSYSRLKSIDSYVSDPRWALVKLHGSVNWGRRMYVPHSPSLAEFDFSIANVNELIDQPPSLELISEIDLRLNSQLAVRRFDTEGVYYPALSVPLGAEDEIVCPESHVTAARERLGSANGINLLVIGYSGLDKEVLRLLRESGAKVQSLLIAKRRRRVRL